MDKRNNENYRGISVTRKFSRIYGHILAKLVESEYQNLEMEEQSVFRARRSCIDKIFCLTHDRKKRKPLIESYIYYLSI